MEFSGVLTAFLLLVCGCLELRSFPFPNMHGGGAVKVTVAWPPFDSTRDYMVTAITTRMSKQPVKNESRKANMWESNKSEPGGRVAAEASPVASNHQ